MGAETYQKIIDTDWELRHSGGERHCEDCGNYGCDRPIPGRFSLCEECYYNDRDRFEADYPGLYYGID